MSGATAVAIRIPRPLPHQFPILDDPSPRKLWRAGRRTGKSVAGRISAIRGHGPKRADGRRELPGMLAGANVAWITKTYKQSKVVWRKLLRAFRPLEGVAVTIDREDKRIEAIGGGGAITVWSGHTRDAIDNLRGDAYDGVILDEAAYIDLEYALNDVVEPALLDHGGWVFVFSSPNAAWDGNEQRVAPSYFNRLCAAIISKKERLWHHWHNRTEDNPRLDRAALAALRERLGPESVTAQQELDASLVAGGLLALAIDRDAVYLPPQRIPSHWHYFGAFDWGFDHPYFFGLFTASEDGTVHLLDSVRGRKEVPKDIANSVGALLERHELTFESLAYTVAGHDCWSDIKARGEIGPTIAEKVARSHHWMLRRASISRITGLTNLRDYLASGRFKIHETDTNSDVLLCLETRITDPKNPEDVLKQDAVNGEGGDDAYDMVRYGLMSRPVVAKDPTGEAVNDAKRPHRANPIVVKDGRVAATHRQPLTVEQLVDQIQSKRQVGRTEHRERLPRRTYS